MEKLGRIACGSIAVGIAVLALKYLAYRVTGSVALYSDALESIINVVTAITTLLAIRLSALPADANHPYGHHKAEYFAVIVEGICIIAAAVSIMREAYLACLSPHAIEAPVLGLAVNAAATAINAGWGWYIIRFGQRHRSPALVADGRHLYVDVYTSGGVLVGVVLVAVTGMLFLDAVIAGLVGLNILWAGYGLLRESVGGLMDEAVPEARLGDIRRVIAREAQGAIQAHDLKTRHAGRATFIEFHLIVPGEMSTSDAHAICDRLEDALEAEIADAVVTIHVEPAEKAKREGIAIR